MINKKLYNEIKQYVELNELGNTDDFINDILTKAFTHEKYGDLVIKDPSKKDEVIVEKKTTENNIDKDDIYGE